MLLLSPSSSLHPLPSPLTRYNVNVKGLYFCSLAAVNSMLKGGHGGAIINLGSIASLVCDPHALRGTGPCTVPLPGSVGLEMDVDFSSSCETCSLPVGLIFFTKLFPQVLEMASGRGGRRGCCALVHGLCPHTI